MKAGASYISPFIGRLDDIGQDGMGLIKDLVEIRNNENYKFKTEILVASIRHPIHVLEAAKMGADIGTMPADVMEKMFMHPLTDIGLKRFLEFLPDGRAMAELVEWTGYIAGKATAFDVQVILRAAEIPYCRLDDEGADAPRLGWIGWLKTAEFEADAGDAVFTWVN